MDLHDLDLIRDDVRRNEPTVFGGPPDLAHELVKRLEREDLMLSQRSKVGAYTDHIEHDLAGVEILDLPLQQGQHIISDDHLSDVNDIKRLVVEAALAVPHMWRRRKM